MMGDNMRRISALIAAGLLALVGGCSSDSTTPEDPGSPQALSQINLGPDGGTWEHEDFLMHVPAGQLGHDTPLNLFAEETGSALPDAEVASVYRIEGIPLGLASNFRLRLRHGAASGDSLFALVGQPSFVPSLGQTITSWHMVACTDSAGWALFDLPTSSPAGAKDQTPPPLSFTIVDGIATATSGDGRFQIHWSPNLANNSDIEYLAQDLENALDLYDLLGYEQVGFDGWPVEVQVQPFDASGYWRPNPRRLGGHLAVSSWGIQDRIELPITMGHELMHFCQYFYDPRSIHDRGTYAAPQVWLHEATAVHMEIYFAPSDEFPSVARLGHELDLLNGLLTPRDGMYLDQHGYGVSSLIRYLAENEPAADNFILDTYQDIKNGEHAAAALQANTTIDISGQWQHILEELVQGHIFADVTWPVLDAYSSTSLLQVNSATDTTGTVSRQMADLSGLLADVTLDRSDWTAEHRLEFWCHQASCEVSVFGVKEDGSLDLVGPSADRVILTEPAALQAQYQQLLVLVGNSSFTGPDYEGPSTVTLEARVRTGETPLTYTRLSFHLQFDAIWDNETLTSNQEINIWNVDGTFADGMFTADWDSTIDDGAVRFVGQITVTIAPDFDGVTSWSARTRIWHFDNTGSDYQASGGPVPTTNLFPDTFSAWIEGEGACDVINSVSMTEVNNLGSRNLVDRSCRQSSYVIFSFENPGL